MDHSKHCPRHTTEWLSTTLCRERCGSLLWAVFFCFTPVQLILTMFRNAFQHRFVTVFSSAGSKPLAIWDVHTKNGHSRRVTDEDIRSLAFELIGVNVATTYMVAPCAPCPSLSIKLPFLVMLVKNMKKFFCFEVQILDDRQSLRRLRFSNYQSGTRVDNFSSCMPLSLTNYVETVRLQIHANVRIKRIYFCDQLYTNDETPAELRLFPPVRPNRMVQLKAQQKPAAIPHEPIETVRPPTPVDAADISNMLENELAPAQCAVGTDG